MATAKQQAKIAVAKLRMEGKEPSQELLHQAGMISDQEQTLSQSLPPPESPNLRQHTQNSQSQPTPILLPAAGETLSNSKQSNAGEGQGSYSEDHPRRLSAAEKDYAEFFTHRFGPLIVLIIWVVTRGDWDAAKFYAPDEDECRDIAPHAARILSKYNLPKQVRTAITTSDDTIALLFVLAGYFDRIGLFDRLVPMLFGYILPNRERKDTGHEQGNRYTQPIQKEGNPNGATPWAELGITGVGQTYNPDI